MSNATYQIIILIFGGACAMLLLVVGVLVTENNHLKAVAKMAAGYTEVLRATLEKIVQLPGFRVEYGPPRPIIEDFDAVADRLSKGFKEARRAEADERRERKSK